MIYTYYAIIIEYDCVRKLVQIDTDRPWTDFELDDIYQRLDAVAPEWCDLLDVIAEAQRLEARGYAPLFDLTPYASPRAVRQTDTKIQGGRS